jgi:protein-S-isoprenylcysteine O-methyltransferase Ste14
MARNGIKLIFGEVLTKPGVIRKVIMGIIRHPQYMSEILLYMAFISFRISLAAIFVWLIAIGFLYYISRYEEKLLLIRFGEEYKKYMDEVGMFFPKIWKRKKI